MVNASPPRGPTRSIALQRLWYYPVVIIVGMVLWSIVWGMHVEMIPDGAGNNVIGRTGALIILDILLGLISISVLPLRHRAPLTIAITTVAMLTLSASAIGAAVLAVVHTAVVGTRFGLLILGAVWMFALLGNEALVFLAIATEINTAEGIIGIFAGLLLYMVLVSIGRYRRAREETFALLRERAESAEQQRERDLEAVKKAERLRIAREMHDVLAHRITLVSMHSGALTYREDLPREKVTEAAQIIRDNAGLALHELRELLGVLREDNETGSHPPQPTLAQLPLLLSEARAAGAPVHTEFDGIEAIDEQPATDGLETSSSRTAYRIVQEALTNARKHAPGQPIRLRIAQETDRLVIETQNRVPSPARNAATPGMGLIGLTERVELAGGNINFQQSVDKFVLRAWIPWT